MSHTKWGSQELKPGLINTVLYNFPSPQNKSHNPQKEVSLSKSLFNSSSPSNLLCLSRDSSPPTSDLGVHRRAVWISFQNNSHSLESPLAGPLTPVAPPPPSHRYAVPFYYQTSLHLPILVSHIQKCRARITMHWLAFINNILQFPRPGAWINYSSASRLRWSKRWPGWPSSRGGIKRRLWLHQGARLRGGSKSRASVLWLHDNQISENAWTLILRSCWRRDWCDKQVWLSHHSWGLTEKAFWLQAFSTVFL